MLIYVELLGFEPLHELLLYQRLIVQKLNGNFKCREWCSNNDSCRATPEITLVGATNGSWEAVASKANKALARSVILVGENCPSIGLPIVPLSFDWNILLDHLPLQIKHTGRRQQQEDRLAFTEFRNTYSMPLKVDPDLRQRFKQDTVARNGEIMSESKKRKVHLPEFKAKVGLEALRGVKTINEIGQEYGVHPVQVSQWRKEIQEQAKTLFGSKRGPQPVAAHSEPDTAVW